MSESKVLHAVDVARQQDAEYICVVVPTARIAAVMRQKLSGWAHVVGVGDMLGGRGFDRILIATDLDGYGKAWRDDVLSCRLLPGGRIEEIAA